MAAGVCVPIRALGCVCHVHVCMMCVYDVRAAIARERARDAAMRGQPLLAESSAAFC